ncbi:hypothetical protein [Streptomyces lavendulae]|uniref:hypothetical protein n=1 Tax=Streptomyces lavendulae TaxID=1914 RepID=UPI002556DC1E|nr:hypothetical protein [Streptomyces lavendulae]
MSRTTPPRPFDVTALFPRLAPLARTATRLHPRPGSPSVHDSSVGGPLLWPADEPWPHCDEPHEGHGAGAGPSPAQVRLLRRHRAAMEDRRRRDPEGPWATPEELATDDRLQAGRPWPEGPTAMLPVAQLYARDVPQLRTLGPPRADLLQVLWCPFDHPAAPRPGLFWRSAAEVTDVLGAPPEPSAIQFSDYLPDPCLFAPEQVAEYPNPLELSKELREQLGDWTRWQAAAGSAVDSSYEAAPEEFYLNHLSVAPGWKVGGWSSWGLTDPVPRRCPRCDTEMDPLLTIASTEWDGAGGSWAPIEDRAGDTPPLPQGNPPANFTRVVLAGGYGMQIHICPASRDHPYVELIQ